MYITYFNHTTQIAEGRWGRGSFLANWWRIYAGDPGWVPPHYPSLRRELEPAHNSHLARMTPIFVYTEALARRQTSAKRSSHPSPATAAGLFEKTVTATVVLRDPRRRDGTAYLGLLRCVNSLESLEHLLDRLAEILWASGCRRVIGPTSLSPHLETGVLQDYWHQLPPLHTPCNPPYLPELVGIALHPLGRSQLYHMEIPPELPPSPPARAQLLPLELAHLVTAKRDSAQAHSKFSVGSLLPLLAAACPPWADFPPPDAEEAAFLLRWLGRWPLYGWLAQVNEQPVGFVLLQPDLAPLSRRAKGGRNPLWRPWLAWRSRRPVRQGRLLFGAVLPEWRGQGIGRQLLHQALVTGHHLGWRTLSIGPLPRAAAACAFLEGSGARPGQTYLLYQRDL